MAWTQDIESVQLRIIGHHEGMAYNNEKFKCSQELVSLLSHAMGGKGHRAKPGKATSSHLGWPWARSRTPAGRVMSANEAALCPLPSPKLSLQGEPASTTITHQRGQEQGRKRGRRNWIRNVGRLALKLAL